LLGLLDEGGSSLKKIFQAHGLKRDIVLKALADLRGNQRVTDVNPEDKFQALEKYGRDLTALARQGKNRSVIGRDEEIRRVMQVLTRRTKNNPFSSANLALAKPPLPKLARASSAVTFPNAQTQASRRDGFKLYDRRRKISRRVRRSSQSFLKEIVSSEGQIILFIDELHTLVGQGPRRRN